MEPDHRPVPGSRTPSSLSSFYTGSYESTHHSGQRRPSKSSYSPDSCRYSVQYGFPFARNPSKSVPHTSEKIRSPSSRVCECGLRIFFFPGQATAKSVSPGTLNPAIQPPIIPLSAHRVGFVGHHFIPLLTANARDRSLTFFAEKERKTVSDDDSLREGVWPILWLVCLSNAQGTRKGQLESKRERQREQMREGAIKFLRLSRIHARGRGGRGKYGRIK